MCIGKATNAGQAKVRLTLRAKYTFIKKRKQLATEIKIIF